MFKLLVICLSFCLFQYSLAGLTFKDCGSKNGAVTNLELDGCDATPCTLTKGQSATMRVTFKSNLNTNAVNVKCSGVLFGVPIPFPLPEPNACVLGANCPVAQNNADTVVLSLPILKEYPSLSVDVRLQFLGDNNQNLVCFQFPVKISS